MKKKQLPKSYFVEALVLIGITALDYDGYNPKSAKDMKHLVDVLVGMANDALAGKPHYYGGKNKPIWAPLTTGGKFKIYPTV